MQKSNQSLMCGTIRAEHWYQSVEFRAGEDDPEAGSRWQTPAQGQDWAGGSWKAAKRRSWWPGQDAVEASDTNNIPNRVTCQCLLLAASTIRRVRLCLICMLWSLWPPTNILKWNCSIFKIIKNMLYSVFYTSLENNHVDCTKTCQTCVCGYVCMCVWQA